MLSLVLGYGPGRQEGDSHLAGFFQEPQTTLAPHAMGPGMQTHPLSFSVLFIVLNMWKQAAFMI